MNPALVRRTALMTIGGLLKSCATPPAKAANGVHLVRHLQLGFQLQRTVSDVAIVGDKVSN